MESELKVPKDVCRRSFRSKWTLIVGQINRYRLHEQVGNNFDTLKQVDLYDFIFVGQLAWQNVQ